MMALLSNYKKKMYSYYTRKRFSSCHKSVLFEKAGLIIGGKNITIGENSNFQRGLYLTAWDSYRHQHFSPQIIVGNNCAIGAYNHITCINKIVLGDGLLTGKWVTITDNSHGTTDVDCLQEAPSLRELYSKGPVIIGKNVWIGDKATILAGVKIGEGSVIGANSIVTKDVPEFTVVAGNPAKILRNSVIAKSEK